MKRRTTRKGAATSKKELEKSWLACWQVIEQERIKRWVDRIQVHIKEVIRCEGGNEYMEGSEGVTWRTKWMNA